MHPKYLVQTKDGILHSYHTLGILLIDVSLHPDEQVKLYALTGDKYYLISYDDLRLAYKAAP